MHNDSIFRNFIHFKDTAFRLLKNVEMDTKPPFSIQQQQQQQQQALLPR